MYFYSIQTSNGESYGGVNSSTESIIAAEENYNYNYLKHIRKTIFQLQAYGYRNYRQELKPCFDPKTEELITLKRHRVQKRRVHLRDKDSIPENVRALNTVL